VHRTLRTLALGLALAGLAAPIAGGELRAKFELFVDDVAASTRFYETLGFRVAHYKESDAYTTMERDSVVVALSPLPRWLPMRFLGFLRLPPIGTELVFYPPDLERARAALDAAGYRPGEIEMQPWGHRDFRVRDPSGYYVRVSEGGPIPEAARRPGRS
jgi:lactoylglutathione lyase